MKLFDSCIEQFLQLICQFPQTDLTSEALQQSWPDAGKNQMIFLSETACELGGGTLPSLGGVLLTDSKHLVPDERVILCGKDLNRLTSNTPYARLSMIRVSSADLGQGTALFQAIRKIEYTRYHLNPEGFMLRISASNRRESARISRSALEKGLGAAQIGRSFRDAYLCHPAVEAVSTVFITDPDFPYQALSEILAHAEKITKALDHLLQNTKMDCHICNLREICAEVEALCPPNISP